MALRGFNGGTVRAPLKPIGDAALAELTRVMRRLPATAAGLRWRVKRRL
jgi:hypothetical protein